MIKVQAQELMGKPLLTISFHPETERLSKLGKLLSAVVERITNEYEHLTPEDFSLGRAPVEVFTPVEHVPAQSLPPVDPIPVEPEKAPVVERADVETEEPKPEVQEEAQEEGRRNKRRRKSPAVKETVEVI